MGIRMESNSLKTAILKEKLAEEMADPRLILSPLLLLDYIATHIGWKAALLRPTILIVQREH